MDNGMIAVATLLSIKQTRTREGLPLSLYHYHISPSAKGAEHIIAGAAEISDDIIVSIFPSDQFGKKIGPKLITKKHTDPHSLVTDMGWKVMNKYGPQESNTPGDLTPIEINLSTKQIDESFMVMFGTAVKMLIQKMFGAYVPPVKLKGKKTDLDAFARALTKEKDYMQTFQQYGLDSPKTYRSKAKLDTAVSKFERKTGLKWPFQ